ncbi:phosphoglycolate phosphatase [Roseivivax sp.]
MRIAFDLDGTLIDSAPEIRGIANGILAEEGRAPLSLAEATGFIGSGAGVFIARMRAARDLPESAQEDLRARFEARYEVSFGLTRLYPGVPRALEALAAAGHRLALCTNKPIGPTRAVLAHLGLTGIFSAVFGGDSLSVRKPDPAPLLAALGAMGAGPCLYIGDSEVDAETAQRAGVPFLLYSEGYRKTPAEELPQAGRFSDFAELPDWVARLAG